MKLVIPELDHADLEKHGFDINDIFQRKEFGENLKNLVQNSGGAITIGLDSGWGNGKTTFIKMWQGHIKQNMQSIYFDAFANDYQKEPFLALATEIYGLIPPKKQGAFKDKARNVIKSIIRGGLKSGVSVLFGGVVNKDVVDSVEKCISEELISDRFDNATKDKKAMTDFKMFLGEWAKEQKKPVVFIIDELDRCRPDFALELIEQIKHLFSVAGITFLLVINKTQLEASIICKYGDINASEYLQKFVHLWLQLPRKVSEDVNDDGDKYMQHTLSIMLGENNRIDYFPDTEKILLQIIKLLQPSFREIEQILICFAIVNNTRNQSVNAVYQHLLAFVCCLKVCKPNLMEKIITDNMNAEEVLDDLKIDDSKTLNKIIRFDLANQDERATMRQKEEYQGISQGYYPDSSKSVIKDCYNWIGSLNLS